MLPRASCPEGFILRQECYFEGLLLEITAAFRDILFKRFFFSLQGIYYSKGLLS